MNYDQILPGLYLGQKIDNVELYNDLIRIGITHVINLWSGISEPIWTGDVLTLKQEDDGTPRPIEQTKLGIEYAKSSTNLYVHCQWGVGRAPSMIYAILRSRGYSSIDATNLIITARPRCKGCWEHYIPSIEKAL